MRNIQYKLHIFDKQPAHIFTPKKKIITGINFSMIDSIKVGDQTCAAQVSFLFKKKCLFIDSLIQFREYGF